MGLTLERPLLIEEREWRTKHYVSAVERVLWIARDLVRDLEKAAERERVYKGVDHDTRTAGDNAAQMVSYVTQAVSNMDFRQLVGDAADLDAVENAIHATDEDREERLPKEIVDAIVAWETERALNRQAERESAHAKRQAERENQCQGQVHQGGRMVGFRRCSKQAVGEGDDGKKYCGTHLKKHKKGGAS